MFIKINFTRNQCFQQSLTYKNIPINCLIFKKIVSIDKEITPSASFKLCFTVLLANNFYRKDFKNNSSGFNVEFIDMFLMSRAITLASIKCKLF